MSVFMRILTTFRDFSTQGKNFTTAAKLFLSILLFASCSSGPKRTMQITTIYNACNTSLESANNCILNGDYEKASSLLSIASNQAISIDNYDLIISVNLAYVSLCLSYNPPKTEEAWDFLHTATSLIKFSSSDEKNEALCNIAKNRILIANNSLSTDFVTALAEMKDAMNVFKNEPYNQAQCYSIIGDLNRLKNDYTAAEKAYSQAEKIYTSERYLSEIGITWYKIAQNRSLSGNKKTALQALSKAIYYDRLAENSMGLGADYYIKAVILLKGNPTEKEKADAKTALEHSAAIYNAANMPSLAEKSLTYLQEIE